MPSDRSTWRLAPAYSGGTKWTFYVLSQTSHPCLTQSLVRPLLATGCFARAAQFRRVSFSSSRNVSTLFLWKPKNYPHFPENLHGPGSDLVVFFYSFCHTNFNIIFYLRLIPSVGLFSWRFWSAALYAFVTKWCVMLFVIQGKYQLKHK
jgi:hypothetical protein